MKPILVFQTDFTYKEGAVSSMYGVVKTVDPTLEIITGSHELPHFDTWSASYRLYQTVRFWPAGTVFISVVDPGVGTSRRACVARTEDGYYIVTPDNGTLTHMLAHNGISCVREIDLSVNRLNTGSSVFHGRDVFAYTAARLASGVIDYAGVGPEYPVSEIVRHPIAEARQIPGGMRGIFEIADPNFGNLWSNIPASLAAESGLEPGRSLKVRIVHNGANVFSGNVPFCRTFGEAERGAPVVYINELTRLGFALREDNAMQQFGLSFGPKWEVELTV